MPGGSPCEVRWPPWPCWALVGYEGASESGKLEGVESGEGRMMEGWEVGETDVAVLAAVAFTDPLDLRTALSLSLPTWTALAHPVRLSHTVHFQPWTGSQFNLLSLF